MLPPMRPMRATATALVLATACLRASAVGGQQAYRCDPLKGVAAGCRSSPTVDTRNGPVTGFLRKSRETSQASVSTFWGIPFAEPPIGKYRLRSPQPLERTWSAPLSATRRSNVCLKALPLAQRNGTLGGAGQAEDCLYLNVYTPTEVVGSPKQLPVMVWIYGGAYVMGDAYEVILGQSAYDGAALAGRYNVVIVTMNYRLNGLGFFASDALRAEDVQGSTGNMALRDQRMAMQWVQGNIAGFGGDPKRVTLFGESAGGFSVMWHLVSRPSWPLFSRAIVESGTSKLSWFFQPYEGHSREFYAQWSEKIGCPRGGPAQLDCLRRVDARLLVTPPKGITVFPPSYNPEHVLGTFPVGPVIDGAVEGLEGIPVDLLRAGRFNRVPLIVGACRDGGTIFEPEIALIVPGLVPPKVRSRSGVETGLRWAFGADRLPQIEAAYPDSEFKRFGVTDYPEMFSRIIRDPVFQCSNREIAEAWDAHDVPVWLYTFSYNLGFMDHISGLGDVHGSDILFIFRHFLWLPEVLTIKSARPMADVISCKWTTFAHTGSPDGLGSSSWPPHCGTVHPKYPAWPRYSHNSRQYYSLRYPPGVGELRGNNTWPDDEFPSDMRCDMWKQQDYPWHGVDMDAGSAAPISV
uniref:Carboxylic ester hydrolase n=1 Tax=Alexandrium monilatum TaxID=311494 RepID=A0A7S4PVK7_9DINO